MIFSFLSGCVYFKCSSLLNFAVSHNWFAYKHKFHNWFRFNQHNFCHWLHCSRLLILLSPIYCVIMTWVSEICFDGHYLFFFLSMSASVGWLFLWLDFLSIANSYSFTKLTTHSSEFFHCWIFSWSSLSFHEEKKICLHNLIMSNAPVSFLFTGPVLIATFV